MAIRHRSGCEHRDAQGGRRRQRDRLTGSGPGGVARRQQLAHIAGIRPALTDDGVYGGTDLGGNFYFTSFVGARYKFSDSWGLGYQFSHMSNARTNDDNPGLNLHSIILLRAFWVLIGGCGIPLVSMPHSGRWSHPHPGRQRDYPRSHPTRCRLPASGRRSRLWSGRAQCENSSCGCTLAGVHSDV